MKRPLLWSPRWHAHFREICGRRWGIDPGGPETPALGALVERAYGASDAASPSELARRLRDLPGTDPEVQAFVASLVVGESGFFRNRPQFEALGRHVLPEIIGRRRARGPLRLRVWSAGCSTGEEPYSLAILLHELLPELDRWDVRVLATDLNAHALRRAREALYSDWSFREADPARVERYFTRTDSHRRLDHPCRALVTFAQLNLAHARFPGPVLGAERFDLVLCRNVMIYFRREVAARTAGLIFRALEPGGWLAVGHSEPDPTALAQFEEVEFPDTFLYRRPEAAAPARPEGRAALAPPDVPRPAAGEAGGRPAARVLEALAAFDRAEPSRSAAALERLAERDPDEPTAPHLLAQLAADARRYDDALFWAFTALQRDGLHVPTLLLVGLVYLEQDDADRARRSFRQAAFLAPEAPEAHLFLSLALEKLGDARGARRHRERAAALAESPVREGPLLPVQQARRSLRAG